jgi:valyl-tRNA synthetase
VLCPVLLRDASAETMARAQRWQDVTKRMARLSEIGVAPETIPAGSAQLVLDEATLLLPLAGVIDLGAERTRLERDRARALEEAEKVAKKLTNADFVSRAKPEVVAENRAREVSSRQEAARLEAALARLG